uniref:Holliday junction resolvase RecU n=1 Tax=viral metagenome TaxID=1070528 RepID=A0A6M3LR56_9ZZZZ
MTDVTKRNRGRWAEARVEQCAALMERLGIATLTKAATPVRVQRKAGKIVGAFFTGHASIDFSGVLSDGSAVHVEVKSTTAKTLPLSRRVSVTQRAALNEALRWTPHVYVLAVFAGPPLRWYLLPWADARAWATADPMRPEVADCVASDLFLRGVVQSDVDEAKARRSAEGRGR